MNLYERIDTYKESIDTVHPFESEMLYKGDNLMEITRIKLDNLRPHPL